MHKIIYSYNSEYLIDKFLYGFRSWYEKLYSDTWIENEYLIKDSYIALTKSMKEFIRKQIYEKLSEETIFWYKLYEDWQKSVKIFLKSFMLEIFYEEDLDEKIRFIENIKISKK